MPAAARYRLEDGRTCIDIKLRTAHQLFDGRDPAPFRERDLDEDAVEYIVGAVAELPPNASLKIVFWISDGPAPELPAETIIDAVRGHFTYELARLDRQLRQHLRRGRRFLLLGLGALIVFLSLAELTVMIPESHVRQILREGFVITGWVAMWRPLEVLFYDWWPLVQQRKLLNRLLQSRVELHHEPGPGSPLSDRA